MAPERVERQRENMRRESLFVLEGEGEVARFEAAGDQEVTCESIPSSVAKEEDQAERGRTELAVAQLEDMLPDRFEEELPFLVRRAANPLLKEEATLLIVLNEDAANEGL
jgi:hypothetical protein